MERYGGKSKWLSHYGYTPLPRKTESKHPPVKQWNMADKFCYLYGRNHVFKGVMPGDRDARGQFAQRYAARIADNPFYWDMWTGLLLGTPPYNEFAIDSDIDDPELSREMRARLVDAHPKLIHGILRTSVGSRWLIIARSTEPLASSSVGVQGRGRSIDLLGRRKFVALDGLRKDGSWYEHNAIRPAEELPVFMPWEIEQMKRLMARILAEFGVSVPEVKHKAKQETARLSKQKSRKLSNIGEELIARIGCGGVPVRRQLENILLSRFEPGLKFNSNGWSLSIEDIIEKLGRIPLPYYEDRWFWFCLVCAFKDMEDTDICFDVCACVSSVAGKFDLAEQRRAWQSIHRKYYNFQKITMGTIRFVSNHFKSPESMSLDLFLSQHITNATGASIHCIDLYNSYTDFCISNNFPPASKHKLTKKIKIQFPNAKIEREKTTKFKKKRGRIWFNLTSSGQKMDTLKPERI